MLCVLLSYSHYTQIHDKWLSSPAKHDSFVWLPILQSVLTGCFNGVLLLYHPDINRIKHASIPILVVLCSLLCCTPHGGVIEKDGFIVLLFDGNNQHQGFPGKLHEYWFELLIRPISVHSFEYITTHTVIWNYIKHEPVSFPVLFSSFFKYLPFMSYCHLTFFSVIYQFNLGRRHMFSVLG